MEEEEHEVYGGDIPDEGDMEGDMDSHGADVDMVHTDEDAIKVRVLSLPPLIFVCLFFSFFFISSSYSLRSTQFDCSVLAFVLTAGA